jgi:hypothetical protein
MNTVLLQINNDKAYKLLADLEDLNIIKVLKNSTDSKEKLSEKYKGVFSKEDTRNFNEHIDNLRNEWNNI